MSEERIAIRIKKYVEHGCNVVEDIPPEGWVVIDTYHPHSTPWDYHGMRHQRELSLVLREAGVGCVRLQKRSTIIHPMGTGPGGAVRFGDNMTPGVFHIAVAPESETAARAALKAHREAIENWLYNDGPMPAACL